MSPIQIHVNYFRCRSYKLGLNRYVSIFNIHGLCNKKYQLVIFKKKKTNKQFMTVNFKRLNDVLIN